LVGKHEGIKMDPMERKYDIVDCINQAQTVAWWTKILVLYLHYMQVNIDVTFRCIHKVAGNSISVTVLARMVQGG
jgi:hypothetical protein